MSDTVHHYVQGVMYAEQAFREPAHGRKSRKEGAADSKNRVRPVRLNKMRDGMVAATTINCIVSMPRLNARIPATRSQRPSPSRPRLSQMPNRESGQRKPRSRLLAPGKRAESVMAETSIETAMSTSMGRLGTRTSPNAANASVIECPSVNAVTIFRFAQTLAYSSESGPTRT